MDIIISIISGNRFSEVREYRYNGLIRYEVVGYIGDKDINRIFDDMDKAIEYAKAITN